MGYKNNTLMDVATILLVLIATGCGRTVPESEKNYSLQETVWPGHLGDLTEWGANRDVIYAVLAQADSKLRSLVIWKWRGERLEDGAELELPYGGDVIPTVEDGVVGLCLGREKGPWPYALLRAPGGIVLKEWELPKGWWLRKAGGSATGKFIAFVAEDGVNADDYKFGSPRARVAFIDVEKRDLTWVADLNGHGAGTIRRVVVSDDGRYVAIAGWNNGTVMVDAKGGKVLWAKRPDGEISTGYAVFAADNKRIFTAGSEGCVYTIKVENGCVVSKRWATATGESITSHRVSALAVSDDGKWLAAGTGPEGEVYVWNLVYDCDAMVLNHAQGSVLLTSFSPDSTEIASLGAGVLKVWKLGRR